jgi:hypothetical protein
MNLLFYVFADRETGLGHWYRCAALADAADGHRVDVVPDRSPRTLRRMLALCAYDWLVVDVPEVPECVYELAGERGVRVCQVNGVGYSRDDPRAALTIVQGYGEAEFSGPEYVVLRPELFTYRHWATNSWFVWGGAADGMNLLPAFQEACPYWEATLVRPVLAQREMAALSAHHQAVKPAGDKIFSWMAQAGRACVAMGMAAWELAALRVPVYAFSATEGHLRFARRMEDAGLVLAYPKVGLPEPGGLRAFLELPFTPWGTPPDGKAAERIVRLMEERV